MFEIKVTTEPLRWSFIEIGPIGIYWMNQCTCHYEEAWDGRTIEWPGDFQLCWDGHVLFQTWKDGMKI